MCSPQCRAGGQKQQEDPILPQLPYMHTEMLIRLIHNHKPKTNQWARRQLPVWPKLRVHGVKQ